MDENEKEVRKTEFTTPPCLAAGMARRRQLVDQISEITVQLSDKDRRHEDGRRWTDSEYHAWRQKALRTLRARESVLRELNDWLEGERARVALADAGNTAAADTLQVEHDAYRLLMKLAEEGVDLDEAEWAVVERLRAHVVSLMPRDTVVAV